jgi:hypothetical protein
VIAGEFGGNSAAMGGRTMNGTIYCLVDAGGRVYAEDGTESHADLAAHPGLNETECQKYGFDLTERRLVTNGATFGAIAALGHLNQRVGTPERLMHFAEDGHLSKDVLLSLLDVESRRPYLEACEAIEQKYTDECAAKSDSCLESGCSIDRAAGEVCLEPLSRAGVDYHKACGTAWGRLFRMPENRIDAWKN